MERLYEGTSGGEENLSRIEKPVNSNHASVPSAKAEQDRDRLISKGRHVLDLCIEENKLLCVQGFVDSQIERGGLYLEVVIQMKAYIEQEIDGAEEKKRKNRLQELHSYIHSALEEIAEPISD